LHELIEHLTLPLSPYGREVLIKYIQTGLRFLYLNSAIFSTGGIGFKDNTGEMLAVCMPAVQIDTGAWKGIEL